MRSAPGFWRARRVPEGRRPGGLRIPKRPDRRAVYPVDPTPPLAHASIRPLCHLQPDQGPVQNGSNAPIGKPRFLASENLHAPRDPHILAGLMLGGLNGGPSVAFAQPRRSDSTDGHGFQSLPPPPTIVGYPPQRYVNMLPPGVAGLDIGSDGFGRASGGLEHREHRHDFHRFDRSCENPRDHED